MVKPIELKYESCSCLLPPYKSDYAAYGRQALLYLLTELIVLA